MSEPDKSKDEKSPKGKAVKIVPPWELQHGRRKRLLQDKSKNDKPRTNGEALAAGVGLLTVYISWIVFPAISPRDDFLALVMMIGGAVVGSVIFKVVKWFRQRKRSI